MDIFNIMMISAGFLAAIFFILLVVLVVLPPSRKRNYNYNRGRVSSDLNKIKEQINGDSEEEEW